MDADGAWEGGGTTALGCSASLQEASYMSTAAPLHISLMPWTSFSSSSTTTTGTATSTHAYGHVVEIFLLSGEAVQEAVATGIPQLFLAATTTIVS